MPMSAATKFITSAEAAGMLKNARSAAIFTHARPDGDTLGSALALSAALKKTGINCQAVCPDRIPERYRFLTGGSEYLELDGNPELFVTADTASLDMLGAYKESHGGRIDISIDHHPSNSGYARATLLDPSRACAGELIRDLIALIGVPLDKEIAVALYTAVASDTGCFKFSNTTAESHALAAEIYKFDYPWGELNYRLFDLKTRAELELEGEIYSRVSFANSGRVAAAAVTADVFLKNGVGEEESSGAVNLLRNISGVETAFLLKETEPGVFKGSLRTDGRINASAACAILGGGGHIRAAGCFMRAPASEIGAKMWDFLRRAYAEQGVGWTD